MINPMICLILVVMLSSLSSCSRKEKASDSQNEEKTVAQDIELVRVQVEDKDKEKAELIRNMVSSKMSEADWMLLLAGRTRTEIYENLGKPDSVLDAGYIFTYYTYVNYDHLTSQGESLRLEFDKKTELLSDGRGFMNSSIADIIGKHYRKTYLPITHAEKIEEFKSFKDKIIGKWGNAGIVDYIFNKDGSGSEYYNGVPYSEFMWKVTEDILSLDFIHKDKTTLNMKFRIVYIKEGVLSFRDGLGEIVLNTQYYLKLPYKPKPNKLFK